MPPPNALNEGCPPARLCIATPPLSVRHGLGALLALAGLFHLGGSLISAATSTSNSPRTMATRGDRTQPETRTTITLRSRHKRLVSVVHCACRGAAGKPKL